uniref:KRAB domain-containing protein n=1 Tax=Anisakis simplex TaxID=6269 RepID=A0A0M3JRI0_ANISI
LWDAETEREIFRATMSPENFHRTSRIICCDKREPPPSTPTGLSTLPSLRIPLTHPWTQTKDHHGLCHKRGSRQYGQPCDGLQLLTEDSTLATGDIL